MKKLVGRASAPARRSAQAGKPVPPEELFRKVIHGLSAHPQIMKSTLPNDGGHRPPYNFEL
jgi:hypothetical protein